MDNMECVFKVTLKTHFFHSIIAVKKVKIFHYKDYNRERNIKGSERI